MLKGTCSAGGRVRKQEGDNNNSDRYVKGKKQWSEARKRKKA